MAWCFSLLSAHTIVHKINYFADAKLRLSPIKCPVCEVTLRPESMAQHYQQELAKLENLQPAHSRREPRASTSTATSEEGTGGEADLLRHAREVSMFMELTNNAITYLLFLSRRWIQYRDDSFCLSTDHMTSLLLQQLLRVPVVVVVCALCAVSSCLQTSLEQTTLMPAWRNKRDVSSQWQTVWTLAV